MDARVMKLVIEGVREDGSRFRPSDWVERLSATVGGFGPDRRLRYSNAAHPEILDGRKVLVVEATLKDHNPALYDYILDFATANKLRVHNHTVCEK